jgi:Tetratricopeptide repeat
MALNNLGNRLSEVGRYRDALTAAEESVTLYRALAQDNPAAHQADLAITPPNEGTLQYRSTTPRKPGPGTCIG